MSRTSEAAARRVISTAESAPTSRPSTPDSSNAHLYPDIAAQEANAILGDHPEDRKSITRRVAAAVTTTMDRRPFVMTKHGQIRRQFDDHPGSKNNNSRRFVREQLDKQAAAGDLERRLRDIVKTNPKQFPGISHTDPINVIGKAIFERQAK